MLKMKNVSDLAKLFKLSGDPDGFINTCTVDTSIVELAQCMVMHNYVEAFLIPTSEVELVIGKYDENENLVYSRNYAFAEEEFFKKFLKELSNAFAAILNINTGGTRNTILLIGG